MKLSMSGHCRYESICYYFVLLLKSLAVYIALPLREGPLVVVTDLLHLCKIWPLFVVTDFRD
jgi:hypothetical protein